MEFLKVPLFLDAGKKGGSLSFGAGLAMLALLASSEKKKNLVTFHVEAGSKEILYDYLYSYHSGYCHW